MWTTGESTRGDKAHRVTQNKSSSVNTLVAYDACSRNQVTGWNLTGFGIGTSTPVPVKGDACLGEGAGGEVEFVVEAGVPMGSLYITYGAASALLQ